MRALVVVILLLPFVIASGHEATASDFCEVVTPSTGASEACELEGSVSRLTKNPSEGHTAFEPTMHSGPDGDLYYALTDTNGVAIGFGAGVARSLDRGGSWEDVSPTFAGQQVPPETNDPYVYVDPWTGRVFSFHMAPILTCSILSFSDDAGESWTTNPLGCGPTGVWDHQTMVAAPPTEGTDLLGDYPNVLVQCVNAIYAAVCARSLDGGLTWTHGIPVHVNDWVATTRRGAQHGHLASEPDGTIYLPTSEGATHPVVYISRDSGLSWERAQVSERTMPFQDPTVAVDAAGTIWVTYQDRSGALWLAHSTDDGATWSEVRVTPEGVIGTMPAMVAGDAGHVAIAYPGTDDVASFDAIDDLTDAERDQLVWGGFWTVSTDADQPDASFTTVEATGDDPLMRGDACANGGRCRFQVDFIEATVTPDGQVFASLSDGCIRSCADTPGADNDAGRVGEAVAITFELDIFDLCAARCHRFEGGADAPTETTARPPLRVETVTSASDDLATVWFTETQLADYSARAAAERARWAAGRP